MLASRPSALLEKTVQSLHNMVSLLHLHLLNQRVSVVITHHGNNSLILQMSILLIIILSNYKMFIIKISCLYLPVL